MRPGNEIYPGTLCFEAMHSYTKPGQHFDTHLAHGNDRFVDALGSILEDLETDDMKVEMLRHRAFTADARSSAVKKRFDAAESPSNSIQTLLELI